MSDLGATGPIEISIPEGVYRVRWRLQIFSMQCTLYDQGKVTEREVELQTYMADNPQSRFNSLGYKNPLGYPIWELATPDYPRTPVLQFSIGYKAVISSVREYFKKSIMTGYRRGKQLCDQVLLSPGAGTSEPDSSVSRLDIDVVSEKCLELKDKGWVHIESEKKFKVVRGGHVVFAVSNFDNGQWQGGFRFGGVELIRHHS